VSNPLETPFPFFALDIIRARGLELAAFSAPHFSYEAAACRATNRKTL
jgi:hypothetical protein